jgi:DNA mismatch endonuclease (patch repair protein)
VERQLRAFLQGGKFASVSAVTTKTMRSIRGARNKTTEMRLRATLARAEVRGWRVRPNDLPGKPDIVFPWQHVVVFTDGCFWHGCPTCYKAPSRNAKYWAAKISANAKRDRRVARELRSRGWSVLRIWEHALKKPATVAERIRAALRRSLVGEGGNLRE